MDVSPTLVGLDDLHVTLPPSAYIYLAPHTLPLRPAGDRAHELQTARN